MDKKDIAEQSYQNGYKQGVKDAAEKFAERLKISLDTQDLYVISNEDIDEICKEITEGNYD